ncbi:MAG: hypothetical protein U1E49_04275 [Hyphomicrobiaceae bacterium]
MIAMLVFASVLWGDGTFFDHDTMTSYGASDRVALDELVLRRRAYWAHFRGKASFETGQPTELGLPLFTGTKEDRLDD